MKKNKTLLQMEIIHARDALHSEEGERQFYNESEGFIGEFDNLNWFKKYGSDYWHYVPNYWFNHGKRIEADLLVIAEKQWLVLEVKNYKGIFEYKHNECYINGKLMSDNQITKMNHRVQRIRHIASEVNPTIEVIGAMIFINEHNEVKIQLENELEFQIIMRHQLKRFIQQFKYAHNYPLSSNYLNKVDAVLEVHRDRSPFEPKSLPLAAFSQLRKGVTCKKCHSFNVSSHHKSIKCLSCGHREVKFEAILRAAFQLRYLYYDHPEMITCRNLYLFCGGLFSTSAIYKTLSAKYKRVGHTNRAYYEIEL